jgi:acetylornithine deacetylase/succinyl-diaminopimelate desuccinylase-like protein
MLIDKVLSHMDAQSEHYLQTLVDFVRIESVSFKGYDPKNLQLAADYTVKLLEDSGLENVESFTVEGSPPYIYAEHIVDPSLPTILLYAHYDVQPPLRDELWDSPAFEATVRDGRLYGRGTSDDKAGVCVHAASLHACFNSGESPPVNVKIFIEGEEEIGSPHMAACLDLYTEKLKADVMIVMDGANYDTGVPGIGNSVRGNVTFGLGLRALKAPLHSGMWGGPLPDPIMALTKLIAGMSDEQGLCVIPGFNDTVTPLTEQEKVELEKVPYQEADFRAQTGAVDGVDLVGRAGATLVERLWMTPTITVTTFESGSRKAAGNVIMDEAWARLSFRIVAGQDPGEIQKCVENYIRSNIPWGLELDLTKGGAAPAWKGNVEHPAFQATVKATKKGYGREPLVVGCGGSIPLIPLLQKKLPEMAIILAGIEDPYTRAHSENESQDIGDYYKAIRSQIHLFHELKEALQPAQ